MKNNKRILKCLIAALFLMTAVSFMISHRHMITNLNVYKIRNYILSYGKFSSIIFIIAYSLKPIVLVVPASIMSILAGNIFGPYKALFLSMVGCFGSGTIGFFISRFLGKASVDKLLKGKALTLDSNIGKHGFKVMLIMRLSFIFPYDTLSFAAGLSKMKYRDFIFGTLIGIFPEMISYSFMGESIRNPFSIRFLLPILMVLVIALISFYIYKASNVKDN